VVSVEVIIFGRPQLTRSSELGITGPPYFLMSAGKSGLASNARSSQGSKQLKSLPLKPVVVSAPFQQWGLDFIGEIHPPSSGQHRWILTATDYFTKWIEAVPTRSTSHKVIIRFLEDIISRFGCPSRIVTDNASPFRSEPLVKFCE
jgi:hypothetical protein